MDFGLLMPFQNPARWARPFPELYQEQLDHIVAAEQLGYDTIWLTEHHFDQDGWSPALLPLAAGIATRTQRIRIGTCILILPFQNALRVAEDATTVDILSNGRFDLGVGKGYRVNEFTGFGIPARPATPNSKRGWRSFKKPGPSGNSRMTGPIISSRMSS